MTQQSRTDLLRHVCKICLFYLFTSLNTAPSILRRPIQYISGAQALIFRCNRSQDEAVDFWSFQFGRAKAFSIGIRQIGCCRRWIIPFLCVPMLGVTVTSGRGGHFLLLSSSAAFNSTSNRRVASIIKAVKDNHPTDSSVKHAILSARKKDRIKLPYYEDGHGGKLYHISHFFNHPAGVEAVLNVDSLEKYDALDSNTYRCRIPAIHFMNFDVSPVLDLLVKPTAENCTVELLSCKIEGFDTMESPNKQFSASMTNNITWEKDNPESFLYVDVKLNIKLKIDSLPFMLLPVSAVEGPGNIVMGALLDRFVPLLLKQLSRDYGDWVKQQSGRSP